MYIEDELLLEEEVSFLSFTKVQDSLRTKFKSLKILIIKKDIKEINKVLKEIEDILEWYC